MTPGVFPVKIIQEGKHATSLHHRHNIEAACSACEIEGLREKLEAAEKLAEASRAAYEALALVSGEIYDASDTDAAWQAVHDAIGPFAAALALWEGRE